MRTDARVYIYRHNIRLHATVYQFAELCLDGPSPLSPTVTKTGLVGFHRCQRVGYQRCAHHHPCSPATRRRTSRRCDSTGGSGLGKRQRPCGHACMHGRCATRASLRTRGDPYSLGIRIRAFSSAVCRSRASFACRSATWHAVWEVRASPARSACTAGRGLSAHLNSKQLVVLDRERPHGLAHISFGIGSLHLQAVRAQRAWHRSCMACRAASRGQQAHASTGRGARPSNKYKL
jgi:hypothetical protein